MSVIVEPGTRAGSIVLRLARPERLNAIDLAFARSLRRAVHEIQDLVMAGSADCVILVADGEAFCVGGDLRDFPSDAATAGPHLHAMSVLCHDALAGLIELPVPVLARVHGAVAGAGIGLAVCADVVVASARTRFRAGYSAVGLSPDCGVSWLLPRLVGERRAMELLLSNRTVAAAEALDWGLVSRVVEPAALEVELDALVAGVLAMGRDAAGQTKRLIRAADRDSLRAHLADEGTTIAELGTSEVALAARRRFLGRPAVDQPGPGRQNHDRSTA